MIIVHSKLTQHSIEVTTGGVVTIEKKEWGQLASSDSSIAAKLKAFTLY